MITDPMSTFAVLAAMAAVVYWASDVEALRGVFKVLPPLVWLYFLPMALTSMGVLPTESPTYDWMGTYLLPVALLLLTISIDLPALARMGVTAITMLIAGTIGVALGVVTAYVVCRGVLPPDAWQSLSLLCASWIGGAANMIAIHQSLGADPGLFGPLIIVDTVVGYGWLGVLLAMSTLQGTFDRLLRADRSLLDDVVTGLAERDESRKPARIQDIMIMVGGTFAVTIVARSLAGSMPKIGDPTIVSASTWTVIFVVTLGLVLSFTRIRRFEHKGATDFGYAALFLMISSIGARSDVRAILEVPELMIAGVIVMTVHVAVLVGVAYLLRAPFFFVATCSMANIGGAASAPVAAAAYVPSLAAVGVLLGVSGYVLGIYVPIVISGLLAVLAGA